MCAEKVIAACEMRLNEVLPGKQLGASAVNWSAELVCLRMHGIPRALGCRAYLSVGREVGALCVAKVNLFLFLQFQLPGHCHF